MNRNSSSTLLLALAALCPMLGIGPASAAEHASPHADHDQGQQLGSVTVPASCKPGATAHLQRGMALLHHMTYEAAGQAFAAASRVDPECALAWWGQAMSYIHPLWSDPPTAENFRNGQGFVRKALAVEGRSAHESAYIAAADAYYREGSNPKETANLAAFERAWSTAHEQFPDDLEIAAFHALALLGTADPADKSYAKQKRAAQMATTILERVPDHPGAQHYLIHALDYPALAGQALDVARQYGHVAPDVAHALHMPTHIFTRRGLWQESIDWNLRSAAAAIDQRVDGAASMHYLHALDYLAYAYLQVARDQEALGVLRKLQTLPAPYQVEIAVPYAFAAVPARLALERRDWKRAAALEPRVPASFPWDQFPSMEAITRYARALGAARSGDTNEARQELQKLSVLRDEAARTSKYWAAQVEIQRSSAAAWLAKAEGDEDRALTMMREAAQLEASTEKHPVTPGEVLPAAELLGDMLMETGHYADARRAYDDALARSPRRLNGLYGSARAAELAGDKPAAAARYRELVELTSNGNDGLEPIRHARVFLGAR